MTNRSQTEGQRPSQAAASAAQPHFSPAPCSRGRGRGSVGRGGRGWEEEGFSSLSWTLTATLRWAREQVQVRQAPRQPLGS